jgi:hypothetical protein
MDMGQDRNLLPICMFASLLTHMYVQISMSAVENALRVPALDKNLSSCGRSRQQRLDDVHTISVCLAGFAGVLG